MESNEENTNLWDASSEETENEVIEEEVKEPEEVIEEVEEEEPKQEITKGSKVRFTGTKSYSGLNLSLEDKIYNVKELSNDRAVLSNGTAVVGAVNTRDLILIN